MNVLLEPQEGLCFEVDALVAFRGGIAVVEVDGPHHATRYAADRSRDHVLEDHGIARVIRVPVEATRDQDEIDAEVERVLRLAHRLY